MSSTDTSAGRSGRAIVPLRLRRLVSPTPFSSSSRPEASACAKGVTELYDDEADRPPDDEHSVLRVLADVPKWTVVPPPPAHLVASDQPVNLLDLPPSTKWARDKQDVGMGSRSLRTLG